MQIAIHLSDADLAGAVHSYVERRLRFALSRFGGRVGHVTVRVSADGPVSTRCQIEAELLPFGHVAVEETDSGLFAAIDRVTGRIGRFTAFFLLGSVKQSFLFPGKKHRHH